MSDQFSNAEETNGRFQRDGIRAMPPIEVDCSEWMNDIPADQWTTGTFQRACRALPPVAVDFVPTSVALEITLTMEPQTKPEQAFLLAVRILAALSQAEPEAGLTYDSQRSRIDGGCVIIVLAVNSRNGVSPSVECFSNVVRESLRDRPEAKLNGIHIASAA